MANALEAMPAGGLLRLGLSGDQRAAFLTVADTGRGIANEDIPFLFDPFFTTKADAVGISLSMVKRIASEHDGDVEVTSEPGRGSTFTLTIPLGLGEAEGQSAPAV
jgi:signal transduction histidine kinase